jgi:VWFA-related protein
MHPLTRRSFVFSAVALLRAQQEPKFSADVKVVSVYATVRNKKGQIVNDLAKDDFAIQEDNHPQTIRYFSRETDLPLTLGLLIDTSGSQRRVLPDESHASYRFLQQVLREDKDMAFVIHFDREVELLQDLTNSRKKLEDSLSDLHVGQQRGGGGGGGYPSGQGGRRMGNTALYDAVLLGSDEIMKKQSGRKAVIILSDGVDNASKVSIEAAIESAQRTDTLAYSILFSDEQAYGNQYYGGYPGSMGRRGRGGRMPMPAPSRPNGKKILERISKETGARMFEVTKKQPIEKVFELIQEELRNQYSLGYTSDQPQGPSYRRIHLTVKQKGMIVQARDGYYAT